MSLPLLPLRDVVVSPYMVIPLFVGRLRSIKALEVVMSRDSGSILLVAQRLAHKDDPHVEDLYDVGCVANVLQALKLPDGTVKVLVEGSHRVRVLSVEEVDGCYMADVESLVMTDVDPIEVEAMRRAMMEQFEAYVKLNKKIPPEVLSSLSSLTCIGRLADSIAVHLPLKIDNKQKILELNDVRERVSFLLSQLEVELDILQVEKRIRGRVKRQMEKSQREYYLNEQVKAIQKELGEEDGVDFEEMERKIRASRMSKEASEKALSELKKLRLMSPISAEATVVRNYIEAIIGLPWKKRSSTNTDLSLAQSILDEDHYGLDKVKERVLEYLAVNQRVSKSKAPILCFVGSPGVGKTSLAQSIARAMRRKFVRMALGGVRDEAEIRGHRRTYIGSMPGKILQNMTRVGVCNPVFLLDEIDKIAMDYRGDPSSALLEVLDPEQNSSFMDHYIEVGYDLSEVIFIATANSLDIPSALLDRMEVVRLSSYTEREKLNIAKKYLIPKQLKGNGLTDKEISLSELTLKDIVRYYTRESGVRSLDRSISKIFRKVTRSIFEKKGSRFLIMPRNLEKYLGPRKYLYGVVNKENRVGQVSGLAWTEFGGDILNIECLVYPGKGNILRTGSLGDVMKESVEAARSLVRARARQMGIEDCFFEKNDFHVHFPEGATPKDGPSAGIAVVVSMISAASKIPVLCNVAMTGEVTLCGNVLKIGGLKEKLLAAHRGGIKRVLIPEENIRDLIDIPKEVTDDIEITPVRSMEHVLSLTLERMPTPFQEKVSLSPKPEALSVPLPADTSHQQPIVKHYN
ncbi:endopeptidase La [Candidatus Ichthyocystis sparus]|nr:endopeptidase La [Candidatus Ichthyocystis sparus]